VPVAVDPTVPDEPPLAPPAPAPPAELPPPVLLPPLLVLVPPALAEVEPPVVALVPLLPPEDDLLPPLAEFGLVEPPLMVVVVRAPPAPELPPLPGAALVADVEPPVPSILLLLGTIDAGEHAVASVSTPRIQCDRLMKPSSPGPPSGRHGANFPRQGMVEYPNGMRMRTLRLHSA